MTMTSPSIVSWTTFSLLIRSRASLTRGSLFVAVGDSAAIEVVRRELDLDAVARKDADVVPAHLSGDVAEHVMSVVKFDAEHRVREGLGDLTLHLDLLLFGHATGRLPDRDGKTAFLAPLEVCLARPLIEEGPDRAFEILGREQAAGSRRRLGVGLVDAPLEVGADEPLGGGVSEGRPRGQLAGEGHSLLEQLVVTDHAVDDA